MFDYDVYALAGDGCMMEASAARPHRSRVTETFESLLDLRQNHITIEVIPVWLSLKMWRDVFSLMAGTFNVYQTPTISICYGKLRSFQEDNRPTDFNHRR